MSPNQEQIKSIVRNLVSTFGGLVAGWFAAKGWFTVDDVLSVLNSGTFIGLVASAVVGTWSMFVHTENNAVAVVDSIAQERSSPVAAVITTNTVAGAQLAASLPGNTTVVAGSPAAAAIVKS